MKENSQQNSRVQKLLSKLSRTGDLDIKLIDRLKFITKNLKTLEEFRAEVDKKSLESSNKGGILSVNEIERRKNEIKAGWTKAQELERRVGRKRKVDILELEDPSEKFRSHESFQ